MGSSSEPLALIAGSTQMPSLVARNARDAGHEVLAGAIHGITDPTLEDAVDEIEWLRWGDLPGFFRLLERWRERGVRSAVMAGKVEQQKIYDRPDDGGIDEMLAELPSGHTDQLIGAVANVLEGAGIELLDSTLFLREQLARPGVLSERQPSQEELLDIAHGWDVAKVIGGLDIGQTVVVKERAVVAVEGMEGTDACIRRGGELAGAGVIVVKVAKPEQDLRFDVPVVGMGTLGTMAEVGAAALAVEAGKTVVFDGARLRRAAKEADIAVIALDGTSELPSGDD